MKMAYKEEKKEKKNKKIECVILGTITYEKGYERAIEVLKRNPNIFLTIAGPLWNPAQQKVLDYIQENEKKLPNLKLDLKVLKEKDFEDYGKKADVILLPYYIETASGVFSQMLQYKKPIITWNLPFFKEYEDKYGANITVNSSEELEEKILEVYKSKKLREKLNEGAKRLLKDCSWESVAKKHWKLYESLKKRKSILHIIKDNLESFFVLMKEGYKFRDKMRILGYYLKSPVHLINYLIGKKNSRKMSGDVTLKNRYGLFFCGDNFSSIYGSSSICEDIVRKEMILDKGVAVDIGANCGMHTIPLASMLKDQGRVISIEPNKKNIELLKRNIEINKLNNVIVIEKGSFSKKQEMTFYIDDIGLGGSSLLKKENFKKETIQVDTLDNILRESKVDHVELIKIDVMGVELETLQGAEKVIKKFHPKIVFELLREEDKDKVYEFLLKYNYKIKQIAEQNYVAV
jgi:FkbM family methyltransferase